MTLLGLLIAVIIIVMLFYVLQVVPLPQPAKWIVTVIVCLFVIIWLLSMLGVFATGPILRVR